MIRVDILQKQIVEGASVPTYTCRRQDEPTKKFTASIESGWRSIGCWSIGYPTKEEAVNAEIAECVENNNGILKQIERLQKEIVECNDYLTELYGMREKIQKADI